MREVVYRPRAALDMESMIIFTGEVCRNPQGARQTYQGLTAAVQKLSDMPTMGRPFFDESLSHRAFRTWIVGNYRIFYTYNDESITVWRVLHTRQEIDDFALIDWTEEE